MKKYVIDKILYLLYGIAIGIGIYVIINHKVIFDYLFKSSYMPV